MDTVLDRFGNKLQVTMYCYPARMWVVCDGEDTPLACVAVSRVNGVGFEWEDEEFSEYNLLDNLRKMKDGKLMDKKFNWYYHEADYFAGVSEGKVLGCVAMKPDGELFCRWVHGDMRGSATFQLWEFSTRAYIYENRYLPSGMSKIYGLININNKASLTYHLKYNPVMVGQVIVNNQVFNRYEYDLALWVDKIKAYKGLYIKNNIGDWYNPSVLLQREMVNVG